MIKNKRNKIADIMVLSSCSMLNAFFLNACTVKARVIVANNQGAA